MKCYLCNTPFSPLSKNEWLYKAAKLSYYTDKLNPDIQIKQDVRSLKLITEISQHCGKILNSTKKKKKRKKKGYSVNKAEYELLTHKLLRGTDPKPAHGIKWQYGKTKQAFH